MKDWEIEVCKRSPELNQRRLDKGYNKRINQILKERSSWYNIVLEVDEILIILLKARLEGFQKGKLEQKKEEISFLLRLSKLLIDAPNFKKVYWEMLNKEIKQLQKEIGEEKQDDN